MNDPLLKKFKLDESRADLIKEYIGREHPNLQGVTSPSQRRKLIKAQYIKMVKSGKAQSFYLEKVREGIFEDLELAAIIKKHNQTIEKNKKALEEKIGRPIDFKGPKTPTAKFIGPEITLEDFEKPRQQERLTKAVPTKNKPSKQRKIPVCIHLDESMISDLKTMAEDQERSYSSLIRLACKEYLKKHS